MRRCTGLRPSAISGSARDLTVDTAYPRKACEACCSIGAASSPLSGVKRSSVWVSSIYLFAEEIQLLVGHEDGQLDGLLRLVQVVGATGLAGGFPCVLVLAGKGDLAELLLSEPVGVALVRAFPEWRLFLFLRRRLQRSSSAPSSSCAGLRLRRSPSGARRWRAPS